jgi:glycosyltransferase involved in cell wall biosynthesis
MARCDRRARGDFLLPVHGLNSAIENPDAAKTPAKWRGEGAETRAHGPALRIAGVDPEHGFAGGETQVMGLTAELLRAGHRAELVCDPAGELWRRAQAAGIRCHPLRVRNSIDVAAGLRLRALLRANRFDVAHFHTARAHALAPFARGAARALIVTRRMDYRPNRIFARWLFNRAVDGVAAISPAVADALESAGVPRAGIAIIPSGVDCERFRPPTASERRTARARFALEESAAVVGAIGALESRKGHRELIDAMAALKTARPLICVIAGDGGLRGELAAQIDRLGVAHKVRLLGRLEDPRELLWALDIFAMPSLKEGLGVAALEAMACGLPVVASRTGGLADLIEDGRTGMLVAPGAAGALADGIAALADAPARRVKIGSAAAARVRSYYTMAAMAERTLALYRECIRRRAARGA